MQARPVARPHHFQTDADRDLPPAPIDFRPQLFLLRRREGRERLVNQLAVDLLGLVEVFSVDHVARCRAVAGSGGI